MTSRLLLWRHSAKQYMMLGRIEIEYLMHFSSHQPTCGVVLITRPHILCEMKLPLGRLVHFWRGIYQAVGWVFHFYCWPCSNVFAEEIVKLKLDQAPCQLRAGRLEKLWCAAFSLKQRLKISCKEMFNVWEKTDATTNLHMLEGPKLLNIPLKVLRWLTSA